MTYASQVSFDPLHVAYDGQGSQKYYQTAITAADIILRIVPVSAFPRVGCLFFTCQRVGGLF